MNTDDLRRGLTDLASNQMDTELLRRRSTAVWFVASADSAPRPCAVLLSLLLSSPVQPSWPSSSKMHVRRRPRAPQQHHHRY